MRRPAVILGLPNLPLPMAAEGEDGENMYKEQSKKAFLGQARPALLSLSLGILPLFPFPALHTCQAALPGPFTGVRALARAACSSWKSVLLEGPRGCFHPQVFLTSLHSLLVLVCGL